MFLVFQFDEALNDTRWARWTQCVGLGGFDKVDAAAPVRRLISPPDAP
jgi:hypothetical protein